MRVVLFPDCIVGFKTHQYKGMLARGQNIRFLCPCADHSPMEPRGGYDDFSEHSPEVIELVVWLVWLKSDYQRYL